MKGILFGDIHSFRDLNLILSKVAIPPAAVKVNLLDLPGGDGSIDLTEAHGKINYQDRDCTFTFAVFPYEDFEEKKREVSNLLNGRRFNITLDKDPNYYWVGRCFVNEYASDKRKYQIVIGATVAPYKLKQTETIYTFSVEGEKTAVLSNERKWAVPVIVTSNPMTEIKLRGVTYTLAASGRYYDPDICLIEGDNEITIKGSGDVTITWREGAL